jgi:prepilin signal peptidase PulO-like enzyme (type II secretory pathway)
MMLFLVFVLGAVLGSFVNVVVVRMAAQESITGRSHCRSCGRQLTWYHNIPVLSFVFLRGKCAWCRQRIAWQYPLVELGLGLLFAVGAYFMPGGDYIWLATFFVLSVYAVALFVFDLRWQVLPDALTLSGAVVLCIMNLWHGVSLANLLLAALAAAGFFALQYFISRGRWIGSGDIRLGLLIGAALGWPMVVVALVIAYWLGALLGIGLIIFKNYGIKSHMPFGTVLTVSTLLVYLAGNWVLSWYYSLIGLV